jgi:hypothetical protein
LSEQLVFNVFGLTGSLKIDLSSEGGIDGSKTIEGVTETVDGSAKEFGSDWDIDDSTSSLDGVTFLDESIVTEDDNTNVVTLQVQGLMHSVSFLTA